MIKTAQMLLRAANYYKGGIDGVIGELSLKGAEIVRANAGLNWDGWSQKRRVIGAAQVILNTLGHQAGHVDGYDGHNTEEAAAAWMAELTGDKEVIARPAIKAYTPETDLPRMRDIKKVYGDPAKGEAHMRKFLVRVSLPYPVRLSWNPVQRVTSMLVHEKVAGTVKPVLSAVRKHYGLAKMQAMGLDLFGGCFNHRPMRGGKSWSTHSYGIAWDWNPKKNGLRTPCPQAQFCGYEYKAFLDIMEAHGWLPAIRLWGKDAMHFQQARM